MNKRGISLIELVIGMALLAIVSLGAMNALGLFNTWQSKSLADDLSAEQIRLAGFNLQKFLEGTRSFQNLSFQVPAAGLSCQGTGFCVVPDTDIFGNSSSGNDLVYLVTRVPLSVDLKIVTAPPNLQIQTTDGTTSLAQVLSAGDYLVLSSVQLSEVLQLTASPSDSSSAQIQAPSFGPTYQFGHSPGLSGQYVAGDFVMKARILKLGLDPATGQLEYMDIGATTPTVVSRTVTQFSVSYALTNTSQVSAACAPLLTAPGTYSRANWAGINASQCYPGISAVQVNYQANGKPIPKSANYVFNTAI